MASLIPNIRYFSILKRFPELIHGMSTRKGGMSREPFSGLNLGLSTSDERQDVEANRALLFRHLGIRPEECVFPEQVHSDHVEVTMESGIIKQTDAVITNKPNLFLTVQTADCLPVFLYDARFRVCGLVHSGWRGTAGNIVGKTVLKMQNTPY